MPNEIVGWTAIAIGFVSGIILGMRFHRADWLGGYDALRRRLVRLAHIAVIALGMINVLYAQSMPRMTGPPLRFQIAQWGFIAGVVSMPLVCLLTAWKTPFRVLFVVPVASLLAACIVTVFGLVGL